MWTYLILFALFSVTAGTVPKCDDVDTQACRLMLAKQTDLCQNHAVAESLCKRFCNLCPMECYHCDVTVQDYHLCNTTKLCGQGEVCMKKELKSFIDGHHEYQFTCTDRQICDGGNDLVIPFGKRNLNSRDISVSCCTDDLCNYPDTIQTTTTTTTTTAFHGCPKDIVFIVDQWASHIQLELISLINLLEDVISQIDIGVQDNLIAYFSAERHGKHQDLSHNSDKSTLLQNLDHTILNGNDVHHHDSKLTDLPSVIKDVVHKFHDHRSGDRRTFENTVVVIAQEQTFDRYEPFHVHYNETLRQVSNNVITLMVGPTTSTTMQKVNHLVTDSQHILTVDDLRNYQSVIDKLVHLILKC